MVAPDMAQNYAQLFHTNQEPQEFISLDELGASHRAYNQPQENRSRADNHWVSTSSTSAHLYPASTTRNVRNPNDDDDDGNDESASYRESQQQKQQRTYYNLSPVVERESRGTVYSGEIEENSRIPVEPDGGMKIGDGQCRNDGNNLVETIDNDNDNNSNCFTMRRSGPTLIAQIDNEPIIGDHCRIDHRHHHDQRRHENQFQVDDSTSLDDTTSVLMRDNFSSVTTRKRKISHNDDSDLTDATGDDPKSVKSNADSKKQNHSEIEKRRRDKMNTYITELSSMVPMCHAMSRKLDKLTVLRMAVQHLKTILGAVPSYTEVHYKPKFISDQELKTLILQAAEGFVFVVGCNRGAILYVSESVSQTLNYSQDELLGKSWFDILHPKDVDKVKEQLFSSDLSLRERLIDAKTMLPVKTDVPQGVSKLCSGARRSFFCRMKRKLDVSRSASESQVSEESDTTTGCHRRKRQQNVDWKYCVIHCTGYLKSWAPAKIGLEEHEGDGDGEGCSLSCLVAVGRIQPSIPSSTSASSTIPRLRTIKFISRHAIDGKFLFVDQRATLVLGFLPQELLGTSMYEYYHRDDIPHLADCHKAALKSTGTIITRIYKFKGKDSSFVKLQSEWKSFRNPWTKDIEYLISKNAAIYCDTGQAESNVNKSEDSSVKDNYDFFEQRNSELEKLISSHVEMSKIGRRIADEVLDSQRRNEESCSTSSPSIAVQERSSVNPEITPTVATEGAIDISESAGGSGENRPSSRDQTTPYNQQIDVHINSSVANEQGTQPVDDMMEMIGGSVMNESPNPLPSDGNDEAAMAVIMSLLEADAGLGGPVDFSGLPWPLP